MLKAKRVDLVTEYHLDLQGLPCPLPLIKLKKALAVQKEVSVFKMVATDKGVLKDIPAFCIALGLGCEVLRRESPFELSVLRPVSEP